MVEYYNNTLTLEANWLVEHDVMTESQYRHATTRKQVQVLRRGCLNTPALVAYDSMPERFKRKVVEVIGRSPYDLVKTNQLQALISDHIELSQFFDNYKLMDGRYIPQNTRHEYYINAIILEAIHILITDKKAKRSALGHKTAKIWEKIAESVMELDRVRFPHSLPANPRRLESKYRTYRKDGAQSLIHKNFANNNAAKVDDKDKESVIVELLAAPNNLDNVQVMKFYNLIAEKAGWKKITAGTVANWREEYDTMIYAGRRGSVAFSNKKTMQVKRSAPSAPMYFWTLDGWDAELLYQKTENGRTTYHNRPTVVVVLDAFNKYPIGYAVGTGENMELIRMALRSAAKHTEELFGRMYRTHQIQSDRFAVKAMTPFYEVLGKHYTPARAKNAKAKIIEPYFNHINKTYCQIQPNWSGFGITSDAEKQPNVEYLNKYKNHFPDFDQVCRQIDVMIMAERSHKIEEFMRAWDGIDNADKIELSRESYLLQFGSTTGRQILMQHNGLLPTINGVKYTYDCFDVNFRKHSSVKWNVVYDPDDMSRALAVNEDQTLQFLLEEKYVQPMALKDRKDGDSQQLQRVNDFNKQLKGEVTEFRAMSAENASEFTEMLPQFETLKKMCITDSKGQHKKNKYLPPNPPGLRQAQPPRQALNGEQNAAKPKAINLVQTEITEESIYDKL